MIKVTPYYEWEPEDARRDFEREYLRMVAAVTPFFPEDVLFDDPTGLAACVRRSKKRNSTKNGETLEEQIAEDANRAEQIVKR